MSKTLKNKTRSECIRETTEVGSITKVMRSQRLRWYRLVERMTEGAAPIVTRKTFANREKISRPKKQWIELVTEDIKKKK